MLRVQHIKKSALQLTDDPPVLAHGARSEEEAMDHYRRVRDEIRAYVETLPGALDVHEPFVYLT